ncbi:MAG: thioredoxin family protein [Gammaproteobacteria bacterium]
MKYYLLNIPRLPGLLFIILSTLFATTANSAEPEWQIWSDRTLAQAKQQNKLLLIDLTAEWCTFCKKMDQTTYQDKAVLDEIKQHYIAIKADEAEYPELAKRFSKVGRPGTIILDSNGNELLTKSGYLKPQWMLWMLQAEAQQASAEARQNKTPSKESNDG